MKKVIRIDANGMFVGDVILSSTEETPQDCVETPCNGQFYHPKWNGSEWLEGLTQQQIEDLLNSVVRKEIPLTGDQVVDILKFNGYEVWPL
jgi:hypothetical protein